MRLKMVFVWLCLLSFAAQAAPHDLKGLAVVRIKSKHIPDLITEQAVMIRGAEASFVGLSDFGTIAFVVRFAGNTLTIDTPNGNHLETSGKKLKNLLSLPLSKDEFLAVIRFERPPGFRAVCENEVCTWTKPGEKALGITFSDFGPLKDFGDYPRRIVLTYKKSVFDLKWQNLSLQSEL